MSILGQAFNAVRKAPIAGKFMQRTGNFLQRNFNPFSAQGYKQTLRNLSPKTRANLKDFDRSRLGELSDATRATFAMPIVNNVRRGLLGAGIADSLSKGDYGTAATEAALFAPGRTLGALKTVGRMAAPFIAPAAGALVKPVLGAGALFAAVEGLAPARVATGRLDALTPEQRKALDAETRRQQENMSAAEKRTMGITPAESVFENLPPELLPGGPTPAETDVIYGTIPPSVNDDLPGQNYDSSVTLPGAPTINNPPNNLPSSPEAVVANPLQQKMAEYEQGRAKATTQEEMNAVRDLGMSIHQAANPQMYEESYNPLMAATFPERYTKTPEDFIVQGGIQAPRSMTEKDAAQATAFGNKVQNIQGLDANPMYNPFEAAEEQSRLDKALAAVIASRRFNP